MEKLSNLIKKVRIEIGRSYKVVGIYDLVAIGIVNPCNFRKFPIGLKRIVKPTPFGLLTIVWK